jgi:hypothetical protein
MNLRNVQREGSQTDTIFHLSELSRKGIFIEIENRSVVAGTRVEMGID